jgi:hypothetical protein
MVIHVVDESNLQAFIEIESSLTLENQYSCRVTTKTFYVLGQK